MERFTVEGECWVSDYSVGSHGYAQVGWYVRGQQTMTLAHRVAYLAVNGPIPNDLTVDHICHNRRCINPGHLRLLSNVDNGRGNGQPDKTHCPSGHAYAGPNLYTDPKGHRRCRECARNTYRARAGVAP